MKKLTLTALITLFVLSFALIAVKTKPAAAPAIKDCCKVNCSQQKPAEETQPNSGLIFWDTYSTQLLQVQPTFF